MLIPKDILDYIATYLGTPEKERRERIRVVSELVAKARKMYLNSNRKRKPKHIAEGINYTVMVLLVEMQRNEATSAIFQEALKNAVLMGM